MNMSRHPKVTFCLSLLAAGGLAFAAPAMAVDPAVPAAKLPAGSDLIIEGHINEVYILGSGGQSARNVGWRGRQLILNPDWAIGKEPGGACRIKMTYTLTNLGDTAITKPFIVQILNGKKVVTTDHFTAMAAGEHRKVETQALFTEGRRELTIRMDAKNAIREIHERNNDVTFPYELQGRCN